MSIQDALIDSESIKNRSDLQTLLKLFLRKPYTRPKLHCHFSSGGEIEVVIGKEAVMIGNRKINSLCKLIAGDFDLKPAAYTHHFRIDGRFGKRQLLE